MRMPTKYRMMPAVLALFSAVVLSGFLGTPANSMAAAVETTTTQQQVAVAVNALVIVSPGSVDVYLNAQIANLMNGQAATPDYHFANLSEISASMTPFLADLAMKKLRLTIYFTGNDVLSGLDSAGIEALKQLAAVGAVLAVGNPDGSVLRNVLGMDSSRNLTGEPGSGTSAIYLLYGTDELLLPLEGMSVRDILTSIFKWIVEVDEKEQTRDGSPWTALRGTVDWRINNYFSDNNTARFLMEAYKLASTDVKDWYRFDFSLTSTISSYGCGFGSLSCGWYTTDADLSAELFYGAQLYEYMPTGTLSNRTETLSIGGTLNPSGPGLTAGYTKTFSSPDMSIRDITNFSTNTAAWDLSFNGPDYRWWPFITEPASVARSTYTWQPSLVAHVPAGKRGVICVKPKIRYQKDNGYYVFFALIFSGSAQYWSTSRV